MRGMQGRFATAAILLLAGTALCFGCTKQGVCDTDPADPECCMVCQDDPTAPWCFENEHNAGSCAEPTCDCDAQPRDGGMDGGETDAGPCAGACDAEHCLDGACVDCTEATAGDDCGGDTPLCDTDTNTCVECTSNTDCTDEAMPICDGGSCRGCTEDTDCEDMTDTPVCDEPSGRCAECTVDSEETTCPPPDNLACDPTELTCTGAERGSLGFCQPCVSDSECITNASGTNRCVPMQFEGSPHGTYCLLDLESYRTATSMPSAPCPDRMVTARTETSILGVEAEYCFVRETLTTCEAVVDTFGDLCPGGDSDCGDPGLDDASCEAGRCTYECSGGSDCATGICTGAPTTYCQ